MQKNDLFRLNNSIYRVVDMAVDKVLAIDCVRLTMPIWMPIDALADCPSIPLEA